MKYLISGIPFVVLWCGSCWPFSAYSVTYMGIHESYTGVSIAGSTYSAFLVPIMFTCMIAYVLVGRFILKVPTNDVLNCKAEFDIPKLTTYQKIVVAALVVLVVGCFCISVLPANWAITAVLNKIGIWGFIFLVDAVLAVLGFAEGIPLDESIKKGLSFDMFFGFGAIMTMATAVSSKDCGITAMLTNLLSPLFGNMSPFPFTVCICLTALILTQFCSNTVIIILLATVIYSLSDSLGLNTAVTFLLLTNMSNSAFCTPAGCPPAGISFANEYLTSKDCVKYGIAAALTTFVVNIVIGYPWGCLLFRA